MTLMFKKHFGENVKILMNTIDIHKNLCIIISVVATNKNYQN